MNRRERWNEKKTWAGKLFFLELAGSLFVVVFTPPPPFLPFHFLGACVYVDAWGRGAYLKVQRGVQHWRWKGATKMVGQDAVICRSVKAAREPVLGNEGPASTRRSKRRAREAAVGGPTKCTDIGCGSAYYAKGLCVKCYGKARSAERAQLLCTYANCRAKRKRRTLCRAHYATFLSEKSAKWPKCAVAQCFERSIKPTRFCAPHDAVYGDGVSKHTRRNLTHEAILRAVLATQKLLDAENFPVRAQDRIPSG